MKLQNQWVFRLSIKQYHDKPNKDRHMHNELAKPEICAIHGHIRANILCQVLKEKKQWQEQQIECPQIVIRGHYKERHKRK